MKVAQLVISETPTNFVITSTVTYIQTTLQNSADNYDLVEVVVEYDNAGIGLCGYSFSRKKGDVDNNGYLCFGFMDRNVVQYCVRVKGTLLIINGAITWGTIKKLTLNFYNYVEIAQNILETKIVTESSQLAEIWNLQVEESRKTNDLLQKISEELTSSKEMFQSSFENSLAELKKIPENISSLKETFQEYSQNVQEIENRRFGYYDSQEILNHLNIVDETATNELESMKNKKGVLDYYANRTP